MKRENTIVKITKKKIFILSSIIIFILFIIFINIILFLNKHSLSEKDYEYTKVEMKLFTQTQLLSGVVRPTQLITYNIENKLNKVFVEDGDYVEKGQKLFEYKKDEQELKEMIILSESNGYVQIKKGQNNEVSSIIIINDDNLTINSKITELQKPLIKVGQEVKITSKAFPEESWVGSVEKVSNYPREVTDSSSNMSNLSEYDITVSSQSLEGLIMGYHVFLEVITSQEELKVIPKDSVIVKDGSNYVFILKNNQLEKRVVDVRNIDQDWLEIIDGINTDEHVLVNPSTNTKDGEIIK